MYADRRNPSPAVDAHNTVPAILPPKRDRNRSSARRQRCRWALMRPPKASPERTNRRARVPVLQWASTGPFATAKADWKAQGPASVIAEPAPERSCRKARLFRPSRSAALPACPVLPHRVGRSPPRQSLDRESTETRAGLVELKRTGGRISGGPHESRSYVRFVQYTFRYNVY